MTIEEIQKEIIDEFGFFEDWDDKYRHIIDMGKELAPFPEDHRNDEYRVRGCQSQVWLYPVVENGTIRFYADSDALIVKGLISLLLRVYSGHTPQEIKNSELIFIDQVGLGTHLSPTRSNGLAAMLKQIRYYAVAMEGR